MEEIDVEEIKKWLESGEIMKLAEEFGITPTTAYRHLSPKAKRRNLKFVLKCAERAIANKAMIVNAVRRLKEMGFDSEPLKQKWENKGRKRPSAN